MHRRPHINFGELRSIILGQHINQQQLQTEGFRDLFKSKEEPGLSRNYRLPADPKSLLDALIALKLRKHPVNRGQKSYRASNLNVLNHLLLPPPMHRLMGVDLPTIIKFYKAARQKDGATPEQIESEVDKAKQEATKQVERHFGRKAPPTVSAPPTKPPSPAEKAKPHHEYDAEKEAAVKFENAVVFATKDLPRLLPSIGSMVPPFLNSHDRNARLDIIKGLLEHFRHHFSPYILLSIRKLDSDTKDLISKLQQMAFKDYGVVVSEFAPVPVSQTNKFGQIYYAAQVKPTGRWPVPDVTTGAPSKTHDEKSETPPGTASDSKAEKPAKANSSRKSGKKTKGSPADTPDERLLADLRGEDYDD